MFENIIRLQHEAASNLVSTIEGSCINEIDILIIFDNQLKSQLNVNDPTHTETVYKNILALK